MKATDSLSTARGTFSFEPVELFHGRGRINSDQSAQNLRGLRVVMEERGIRFGIIYGTLLGAVREGAFIPWDEDVDVFMLDEDREALHEALWDMREAGLELIRKDGDIYSVMKGGDYIDIYVFRLVGAKRWCNSDVLLSKYFSFRDRVDFLGGSYFCPTDPDEFLEAVYGSDWRIPKEGYPARPWSMWRKFKRLLKDQFPSLARWYLRVNK